MKTDPGAKERRWFLLCGPVLRMHSQPRARSSVHSGSTVSRGAQHKTKLHNLCWVPPVATIVEHYTGERLSCESVLTKVDASGLDDSQDPLEVLEEHWGIPSRSPYIDGTEPHSGGVAGGWDAHEMMPLYDTAHGCEHVVQEWWGSLTDSITGGHPIYLLAERLEGETIRHAKKQGASYCHCLLVVGFEGKLAALGGGREEVVAECTDRRGMSSNGATPAPRLLVKDPSCADRLLEASFESHFGAPVQLRVFLKAGKSDFDRFRVKGSASFEGVLGRNA